jgi:phosphatidate cytidylyltransferase
MPDNLTASQADAHGGEKLPTDLKVRIIAGSIMAAVGLALTYAGSTWFALLVLLVALVISWEWGRVVRGASFDLAFLVHAAAVSVAIILAAQGYAALGLAVIAAAAIVLVPLVFGSGARLSVLGMLYVGVPAVALLWLRGDEPYGFLAVLLIFAIVWASDTAAYAAGRLIGGPKLWSQISPNKTGSGLLGGLAASTIAAALFSSFIVGASPLGLALTGLVLGLVGQAGDLAESALKRMFGLKDASALIPGHGGFMDRMDSILPVAAAAGMFALAVDPHAPARALLFGI